MSPMFWRLQSTGQRWCLVNEACIVDLLDKKIRDVGARDEAGAPVACIHKHAIRTCAPPVGQDSRTHNCPASPYDPLLCVLVGVNTTKNQAKGSVVKESATASAVAGSETGDANQASNCARLHRIDQDTSGDGKQARSAEDHLRGWRNAKGLNDRVSACHCMLDCPLIKRIAIQFLKLRIAQAYCAR